MLMIVTGYTIIQRRLYPATINMMVTGVRVISAMPLTTVIPCYYQCSTTRSSTRFNRQCGPACPLCTVRTPPQSSITPALVEHVRTYMGEDERENHWD